MFGDPFPVIDTGCLLLSPVYLTNCNLNDTPTVSLMEYYGLVGITQKTPSELQVFLKAYITRIASTLEGDELEDFKILAKQALDLIICHAAMLYIYINPSQDHTASMGFQWEGQEGNYIRFWKHAFTQVSTA
ncbi:hypothetical protein EIN_500860 [Entamoeba invadens IP1]|uniref:Uncharacterized protein n=2 Tax=Entamoeba invadens TaxID=33085 RepID=L7FJE5_ENTIV|nr:hypothetical protein EIN_500860 [Entamoeba invadens IP1]ELP83968.1 hypothetical protein EIN_500860 [Entamoeba invadens IP1]|eukprot:XP_004183314.1 hypothetical protein EIN_500860 [Entamoeba invadens IP1]